MLAHRLRPEPGGEPHRRRQRDTLRSLLRRATRFPLHAPEFSKPDPTYQRGAGGAQPVLVRLMRPSTSSDHGRSRRKQLKHMRSWTVMRRELGRRRPDLAEGRVTGFSRDEASAAREHVTLKGKEDMSKRIDALSRRPSRLSDRFIRATWTFRLEVENETPWMAFHRNGGRCCCAPAPSFSLPSVTSELPRLISGLMISRSKDARSSAGVASRSGWSRARLLFPGN